jgi:hypothetical protein
MITKINPMVSPINDNVHIAENGEAIQLLDAWMRNEMHNTTPWKTIIDNVNKSLKKWNDTHPWVYGKWLIAQAIIRGWTQFLTKAWGISEDIQKGTH